MDKLPVTARLRCVATEKRLLLDGSLPGQELSTRERTILTLLAQGYTNQQNADQFLSTKTVETYRSRIACSTAGRVDGRSRVKSSCFGNCSSLSGSPDYRPEAQVLYSVTFLTCGLALLAAAINQGGLTWLLVWPSISFLLVGLAYLILGPGVFGKRSDGRIAWWNGLLLLPFLMLTWAVWHLLRFVSREPACHQVAANLHVGRRLYPHEIPDGVTLIIDLTAEFSEPPAVLVGRSYRCLPTLDAQPPPAEGLRRLAEEAAAWPGGVLVHCANGHGRSATVAAAILLARGLAVDVRQAEALLRQKRPGIRLKPGQRQAVAAFISRTRTSFAAPAQS